jgi:hypothetical protein
MLTSPRASFMSSGSTTPCASSQSESGLSTEAGDLCQEDARHARGTSPRSIASVAAPSPRSIVSVAAPPIQQSSLRATSVVRQPSPTYCRPVRLVSRSYCSPASACVSQTVTISTRVQPRHSSSLNVTTHIHTSSTTSLNILL